MSKVIDNKSLNNNLLLYFLFIVVIILFLISVFINRKSNKIQNKYASWLCSGTHNVKLELEFNGNSEFIYDAKNESDSIYVNGSYSFEKIYKEESSKYIYYRYTLYPYKIIRNELEETEYNTTQYEIGISSDGKNAIVSSIGGNERFSCRRK